MSSQFSSPSGGLKWKKSFDALDDRLHDVHVRDDDSFQWPKLRRSRTLPMLGVFILLAFIWKAWPERSKVDWTKYAYVQYATDEHSLCNAVMMFESLQRYGSKADRVLMHNPEWATLAQGGSDRNSQLLSLAAKKYGVTLQAVHVLDSRGDMSPSPQSGQPSTWDTSITKLRAFELTIYDRLIHIDSDANLYDNLDELFLLPKTPLVAPRAYWSNLPPGQRTLTSMLMVLEPNPKELRAMMDTLQSWRMDPDMNLTNKYDMDLINNRFASSAMILPHRPYAMLSSEFRLKPHEHEAYLGTTNGPRGKASEWDPVKARKEVKLVHFSDWPLPKPWMMWPGEGLHDIQPDCRQVPDSGKPDCRDREVWKELYSDFRKRRKDICRIIPVSPPHWPTWKQAVGAE